MKAIKQKKMDDYIKAQRKEITRLENAYIRRKEKLLERYPESDYGLKWMTFWDDQTYLKEMRKAWGLYNELLNLNAWKHDTETLYHDTVLTVPKVKGEGND